MVGLTKLPISLCTYTPISGIRSNIPWYIKPELNYVVRRAQWCTQRPSTKLLSIGRQITGRFCWNYDVVHFSFSKIHPIGNRQLPATHIWLVMLQMNYVITNSVKTLWCYLSRDRPAPCPPSRPSPSAGQTAPAPGKRMSVLYIKDLGSLNFGSYQKKILGKKFGTESSWKSLNTIMKMNLLKKCCRHLDM